MNTKANGSFDDLIYAVNEAYSKDPNTKMIAKTFDISISEVFECLGFEVDEHFFERTDSS